MVRVAGQIGQVLEPLFSPSISRCNLDINHPRALTDNLRPLACPVQSNGN